MTEQAELPTTDVALRDGGGVAIEALPDDVSMAAFVPRDMKQLVSLGKFAAESGLYGRITPHQATIIMLEAINLGISPYQGLREIYVINGKPSPSARLTVGLIFRSGVLEFWRPLTSADRCLIEAKRRDMKDPVAVEVTKENLSPDQRSKSTWKDYSEDMLWALAVRRIAKRHFADVLTGLYMPEQPEPDQIVDVAAVEEHTGRARTGYGSCAACGAADYELHAANKGGAYLRCPECGNSEEPPQDVRDAVRGHKERTA